MSHSSAAKAHQQLFSWRLGKQHYVIQVDPFYLKPRCAWPVSPEYARLLTFANRLDDGQSTAIWEALAQTFSPLWLEDEARYSGRNLLNVDPSDEDAIRLKREAVHMLQPWLTYLEVNQVCNLKCQFCYVDQLPRVIGTPEVLHLGVARIAEAGGLFLNITGGEPTLYPGLVSLIRDGIRHGLAVTVRTNLLKLPGDIAALASEPRVVFVVSLHHHDAADFDAFVGRPHAQKQIFENIRRLLDLGLRVRAHIVATTENVSSLPEMFTQIQQLGIPYTITDHVMPFTGQQGQHAAEPLKFKIESERTRALLELGSIERHRNLCTAAQSKLWLDAKGDVYPCELFREVPIGSYLDASLRDILDAHSNAAWRNEFIFSSEPQGCQSCGARSKCPRCPAMVYIEKRTTHGKHDLTCDVSQALHGDVITDTVSVGGRKPPALLPILGSYTGG